MGPLGFETNITAASTIAHRVDALFYTLLALSFVIAFGICFVLVWFAVKYRRGSSADRTNPPAANLKVAVPITLSLGTASWPEAGDSMDALLAHADQAMYAAKRLHKTEPAVAASPRGRTRRVTARTRATLA